MDIAVWETQGSLLQSQPPIDPYAQLVICQDHSLRTHTMNLELMSS
jgi:hypothetical protein